MSAILNRNISLSKIGADLRTARNLNEALAMAGADYEVVTKPLYYAQATPEGRKMVSTGDSQGTFRLDHKARKSNYIATVGSKHVPLQNETQFQICQDIALEGGQWWRGYVSPNGGLVTIRMKIDSRKILDDQFDAFADVVNAHDGTRAARVCRSLEREICSNGLRAIVQDFCLKSNHTKGIQNLRARAQTMARQAKLGLDEVEKLANQTIRIQFSEERFKGLVEDLVPLTPDMTGRQITNVEERRSLLWQALRAQDLENFRGTGWAAIQAAADFIQHQQTNSKMEVENQVGRLLMNPDGEAVMRRVYAAVMAAN